MDKIIKWFFTDNVFYTFSIYEIVMIVLYILSGILSIVFILVFLYQLKKKKFDFDIDPNDKWNEFVGEKSFFSTKFKERKDKIKNGVQKNLRFLYSAWFFACVCTVIIAGVSIYDRVNTQQYKVKNWGGLANDMFITAETERENADYETQKEITIKGDTANFALVIGYKSDWINFHQPINDTITVHFNDFYKAKKELSNVEDKYVSLIVKKNLQNNRDIQKVIDNYLKVDTNITTIIQDTIGTNYVYLFGIKENECDLNKFLNHVKNYSSKKSKTYSIRLKEFDDDLNKYAYTLLTTKPKPYHNGNFTAYFVYPNKMTLDSMSNKIMNTLLKVEDKYVSLIVKKNLQKNRDIQKVIDNSLKVNKNITIIKDTIGPNYVYLFAIKKNKRELTQFIDSFNISYKKPKENSIHVNQFEDVFYHYTDTLGTTTQKLLGIKENVNGSKIDFFYISYKKHKEEYLRLKTFEDDFNKYTDTLLATKPKPYHNGNITAYFVNPNKMTLKSKIDSIEFKCQVKREEIADKKDIKFKVGVDSSKHDVTIDTIHYVNKILRSFPKDTIKYQTFFSTKQLHFPILPINTKQLNTQTILSDTIKLYSQKIPIDKIKLKYLTNPIDKIKLIYLTNPIDKIKLIYPIIPNNTIQLSSPILIDKIVNRILKKNIEMPHFEKNGYLTITEILSLISNLLLLWFFGFANTKTDMFSKNEKRTEEFRTYQFGLFGIFFLIVIILLINTFFPEYSKFSPIFSSSFLFVVYLIIAMSSIAAVFGFWGSLNNSYTSFPTRFKIVIILYAMFQFFELFLNYEDSHFNKLAEMALFLVSIIAKGSIIYILLWWAPKTKRILWYIFSTVNNYRTENDYDDFIDILDEYNKNDKINSQFKGLKKWQTEILMSTTVRTPKV